MRSILLLNATTVAHRYYLAVNPKSGALYVSDPEGYRIMEVVDTSAPADIVNNWRTLVGGTTLSTFPLTTSSELDRKTYIQ